MEKLIKGSDKRLFIYAKEGVNDYNIETIPELEYWVYTAKDNIKKYVKAATLPEGYTGLLVKETSIRYHLNFKGVDNKDMKNGQILIDVMVKFTDSELTLLKCLETINTNVFLTENTMSND